MKYLSVGYFFSYYSNLSYDEFAYKINIILWIYLIENLIGMFYNVVNCFTFLVKKSS